MNNNDEIWKPIKGYEGIYEVSNKGRVRSLDRFIKRSNGVSQFRHGKILSQILNDDGYLTVKLSRDGKSCRIGVHILVCFAFVDGYFDGAEVNHKNCDRTDNCAENLEWLSHFDNIQYSILMGNHISMTTDMSGANNPNYGNRTLSKIYARDKEYAKEKQSRTGEKNGRAKPIKVFLPDGTDKTFPYIGKCAEYLMINHYTNNKSINAVRDQISRSTKNNSLYVGCKFLFI